MSLLTIHVSGGIEKYWEPLKSLLHEQLLMNIHSHDKQKKRSSSSLPISIVENHDNRTINFEPQLPAFQLLLHSSYLFDIVSKALGEFIVQYCEDDILLSLLRNRCEQNRIVPERVVHYCHNILNNDPWEPLGKKFTEEDRSRRSKRVADELRQYIEVYSDLHLEGYITFRLKSYKSELKEVVEYALDEYILDQQYEEFITLLKYFVQLQETKIDMVHLVQLDGSLFQLCDDSMRPLEIKNDNDRIVAEMIETEINVEDIVISSLISASPQKIMIHTNHHEYQVIRTVKTIFGDRAQFCTSCPMCRSKKDEIIPFH